LLFLDVGAPVDFDALKPFDVKSSIEGFSPIAASFILTVQDISASDVLSKEL
jgi:hypothetical protein